MSEPNSHDNSGASEMRDNLNNADERKEQSIPAAASAASSSRVPSAEDARAAQLARRTQLREESECDAAENERRRSELIVAKAAARESCRAVAIAAQAAQRSLSPAQRLFTDGIASCLGFLSLADFNCAAQTCKYWREGAHGVKSLGQSELTASVCALPSLLASPYGHLIQSFAETVAAADCVCRSCARKRVSAGPAELQGLHALAHLTSIDLPLDLVKFAGAAPIQYPPQLTTAQLELVHYKSIQNHPFDATTILQGFVACASLTRLGLQIAELPVVLTPLAEIKQLRHLAINGYAVLHYTPATLHAIKTLPLLETLALLHSEDAAFNEHVLDFGLEWLTPLLTAPHSLQALQTLEHHELYFWDNVFCMQLLPSLPSLTELQSGCVSVLALPALAAFTKLRTLHLEFDGSLDSDLHGGTHDVVAAYDDAGCARLSVLVPHLAHCSLTDLCLTSIVCDGDSLAALCKSHPLLRFLHLHKAVLMTLQPLITLLQLAWLTVGLQPHSDPPPGLFEQICACKSLQVLELTDIAPALSEAQQRRLTPPSTVLPLLTSFDYSSRDESEVDSADSSASLSGHASDSSESSPELS